MPKKSSKKTNAKSITKQKKLPKKTSKKLVKKTSNKAIKKIEKKQPKSDLKKNKKTKISTIKKSPKKPASKPANTKSITKNKTLKKSKKNPVKRDIGLKPVIAKISIKDSKTKDSKTTDTVNSDNKNNPKQNRKKNNKNTQSENKPFQAGDYAVYPSHGVGRITEIQNNVIAGHQFLCYLMFFEKDKLTIKIPVNNAEKNGLRRIVTKSQMEEVLSILRSGIKKLKGMWSRRAQEYETKINSGDIFLLAEVLRDLTRDIEDSERSYSERIIYETAIFRLASEYSIIFNTDIESAKEKITNIAKDKINSEVKSSAKDDFDDFDLDDRKSKIDSDEEDEEEDEEDEEDEDDFNYNFDEIEDDDDDDKPKKKKK